MPIALRSDYDAARLRAVARQSHDAGQTRRLLALAAIYDGSTRTEAAAIGGVTLQIVRDWVVKLNERGPDGLVGGKAPGPRSLLDDRHRMALTKVVEDGPIPAGQALRTAGGSGRMAHLRTPGGAIQHHHRAVARQMSRAEPGRERLAVHARQLALKPRVPVLRRYRRPLLLRLEPTRRSALARHVHRTA